MNDSYDELGYQITLYQNRDVLDELLLDRTTNKNIIWGTDNYSNKGYKETECILSNVILSKNNPIKPRIEKSKTEQATRVKHMAEVFTPSWVCNIQNNLIDEAFFGYKDAFNHSNEKTWTPTESVVFKDGKSWKDYVNDVRLEITCGEAPYLVSRYDAATGEKIKLKSRIGLFDRKMRVVNENASSDEEWIEESLVALKSIYGYEFQGDSLFIARQNILYSYLDYYSDRFNKLPEMDLLKEIAVIISWNIWQMDGLKMVVPFSCHNEKPEYVQVSLFGDEEEPNEKMCAGCQTNDIRKHNGKYCVIMDWKEGKKIKAIKILEETRNGKV